MHTYDQFVPLWQEWREDGLSLGEISERQAEEFGIKASKSTVRRKVCPGAEENAKKYNRIKTKKIRKALSSNKQEIINRLMQGETPENIAEKIGIPSCRVRSIKRVIKNKDDLKNPVRQWQKEPKSLVYVLGSPNKVREFFDVATTDPIPKSGITEKAKIILEENGGCVLQSIIYDKLGNLVPRITDNICHASRIKRLGIEGTREYVVYLSGYREIAEKTKEEYLEGRIDHFLDEVRRGLSYEEIFDNYSGLLKRYFKGSVKEARKCAKSDFKRTVEEAWRDLNEEYEGVIYAIDISKFLKRKDYRLKDRRYYKAMEIIQKRKRDVTKDCDSCFRI